MFLKIRKPKTFDRIKRYISRHAEYHLCEDKYSFPKAQASRNFMRIPRSLRTEIVKRFNLAREAGRNLGYTFSPQTSDVDILDQIFGDKVEVGLVNPTFVLDYPASMSPLAKARDDDPELTYRFELYVAGMELANAFSELNDPHDQRRRFQAQKEALGDQKEIDEDFLTALEYAMPPAGGLGIGIDRLVMILTNQSSIRDVILFPQLRPEKKKDHEAAPDTAAEDANEI